MPNFILLSRRNLNAFPEKVMLMFGCCSLNEGVVKRPGEVICAFISDYPQLMQIRLLDDTTTQGTVMANILSNLIQF